MTGEETEATPATADASASPTSKLDPETLAIRARPPRAIRFRRGIIIGGAAAGSAALIGVAWLALKPQVFQRAPQESELSEPETHTPADALQGLPETYAGVPRLGPPLPGDLGRPILRAQQREMGRTNATGDEEQRARDQQPQNAKPPVNRGFSC